MMTTNGGLETAWMAWSEALVSTLFPVGLGPGQHFAFGQATLMADFANADPQVANAEIFRIADTVPAATPNFVPLASLSDAYGFFLQRVASPALAEVQANMAAANSAAQTSYNMPAKVGAQSPAGVLMPGSGGTGLAVQSTFLPAYELDTSFRACYQQWQGASARGDTRGGGVIAFSSRSGAPATAPAPLHALMLPTVSALAASATLDPAESLAAQAPPAFLRVAATGAAPSSLARMPGSAQALLATPVAAAAEIDSSRPLALGTDGGASDFSLEVSFTGLGTFMIGPARWFSDTAMRLFAAQLSPADKALFFGAGGVLASRIYQVVVAFEPGIILRFDDRAVFENARDALSGPHGGAVGIGPLSFDAMDAGAGGSAGPVYGDETQTITIGPVPSTLPILLGVVSTDLAAFPSAA